MSTVCQFLVKFSSLIVCVLHCFDRVIFKGHLAMARPAELERFVDYVLRVRRCHFFDVLAPQWSEALVEHAKRWARKHKRTYLYRKGSFKKDQWAEGLIRDGRKALCRSRLGWCSFLLRGHETAGERSGGITSRMPR